MTGAAGSNGDAPAAGRLRLRPGAQVLAASPDELHVAFPNYTATFTSTAVTRGVQALLDEFAGGATAGDAIAAAAAATELEPSLLEYLVGLLTNARCLYSEGDGGGAEGALYDFRAYLGDDPAERERRLAAATILVLEPAGAHEPLADVVEPAGARAETLSVPAGGRCGDTVEALCERIDAAPPSLLACWDLPYRSPLARLVNDAAIERGVPVLFGACEGIVGRIGPFVVPRATPCLECANVRLLVHAGEPEVRAFGRYRASFEHALPPAQPAHPAFRGAVARLFAIELTEIAGGMPPTTTGGITEISFGRADSRRHPVLKVPRCPSCTPPRPRRLAWDARFPAPSVKSMAG